MVNTQRSTAGRARNRRGEGRLLREEILSAALDLLDETGDSSAVTLRAVARGAGISAPAIYAHFPDRDAILLAVVQREFDTLGGYLRDAADGAGSDVEDRLLAVCAAYLAFARERPQSYALMFSGIWDARPAVESSAIDADDVADLGQVVLSDLTELLAQCAEAGRSSSTDLAADATVLWVGLHGLAHQRIVSTAFPWPPHVEQRLVRRLAYLA